jgi:hypothetical protein
VTEHLCKRWRCVIKTPRTILPSFSSSLLGGFTG